MAKQPYLYETQTFLAGVTGIKPPISFNPANWEKLAQATMSADAWGYVSGNAGLVLGENLLYPIAIAPIGVQKIFHRDGEEAVAKAAGKISIPYILSSATCTSFEDAAQANGEGSPRWFQLYWPLNSNNNLTISLLQRAKAAGYTVLIVTIDTYAMGWRYIDMDHGYNPFLVADHVGVELGLTDPLFQEKFRTQHGHEVDVDLGLAAQEWASITTPGVSHSWEDLKFLQSHWDGPIVLKGIQSVADAKRAVEAGVQGIVVSNHGGRQQDGVPATLDSLLPIVKAVGDKLDIIFDSGIRSGVDIAKALALGAKCVLIGRPYIWGLAIGGEAGVEHVLRALLGELQMTLHQAGIASSSPKDLNTSVLQKEMQ